MQQPPGTVKGLTQRAANAQNSGVLKETEKNHGT